MIDFFSLLKLQGFPVSHARRVWHEIAEADCDLFAWQKNKRDEQLRSVIDFNPQYRKLIGDYDGNWEQLPILTKELIRDNNLDHILPSAQSEKLFVSSTSGSGGKPFTFTKDGLTHCLTWLLVQERYERLGVSLNDLQARFYGTPISLKRKYFEKTKDFLGHRYRFPVLNISDDALDYWIALFRSKPFRYLYGYSYPLITFAHYLHRRGWVLKQICPSLQACILTAEMCNPDERILVERSLGVAVANEYGTSELGIVGFSMPLEWLLSDELIYTEIVDDDGLVLHDGEMGNIVCTSLFNRATPFIRYNTGDYGAIVTKGGHRYLTGLMGRREDMAVLPSGRLAPGDTVFYYVFKDFAAQYDVIKEYKVIQKSMEHFEIRYVANRAMNDRELKSLAHFCEISLERGLTLTPLRMDVLDRTRMGKFRRFVSEVKV